MNEPTQKTLDALAKSELFRGLTDDDRARVLALAAERSFKGGEMLVREDDEASEILLVVEGRGDVVVKVPFAEAAQVIGQVKRGDVIGEVALVDRCLRSASVRAEAQLEALAIPNEALRRLLEERPALGFRVMENVARLLAGRMRETNLKLRNTIASLLA